MSKCGSWAGASGNALKVGIWRGVGCFCIYIYIYFTIYLHYKNIDYIYICKITRPQEFFSIPTPWSEIFGSVTEYGLTNVNFWLLQDNEDSAVLHDALHHDQYHLAATRVLSLLSLHLMDDNHLPHSLLNYTKFIHDVYGRSLIDLSKAEAVVDRGKILGCTDLF